MARAVGWGRGTAVAVDQNTLHLVSAPCDPSACTIKLDVEALPGLSRTHLSNQDGQVVGRLGIDVRPATGSVLPDEYRVVE